MITLRSTCLQHYQAGKTTQRSRRTWKGSLSPVVVSCQCSRTLSHYIKAELSNSVAHANKPLSTTDCLFRIHVYELSEDQPFDRVSTNPSDASEEITSASETVLPSQQLEGLWESLYYEPDIKSKLLDYIYSTIHFSDADVDRKCVPSTAG